MVDNINIPPPLLNSKPNPPILGLSTAQVMGFIYSHLLYRDLWCHHLGNHSQYHWLTTIINNWHTVTTAGTEITSVPILAVSGPATNWWHYHWWEDNCHYCCSHNYFWNSSEHTAQLLMLTYHTCALSLLIASILTHFFENIHLLSLIKEKDDIIDCSLE